MNALTMVLSLLVLLADTDIVSEGKERLLLYGGLSLTAIISMLLFTRLREVNKQKQMVKQQRDVFHDKNKDILDSINYARIVQEAILPPHSSLKEFFPQSFILHQPKDILAGDFFWIKSVSIPKGSGTDKEQGKSDWTYVAVADCTGHGVPGAMVSVVCSNALTTALLDEGIRDTGKLLDRTREIVRSSLGENLHDGMDISLAAIRRDGKQVRWAGANTPLWLVKGSYRKNFGSLLIEIKADKQPVSNYIVKEPFTEHTIDLKPGDTIYMLSDGYMDQFGGKQGKKYRSRRLKQKLISIQDYSMNEQRRMLIEEFENWRGDVEQVDDICFIGIRIHDPDIQVQPEPV